MQNKKIKVEFNIPLEYVIGHLRYGHREGVLELTEEEFKRLEEDPEEFLLEEGFICDLELVIDDYRIEDYGPPSEINYEVVDKKYEVTDDAE